MATASVILFWLAFVLYIGASVAYGYQFIMRKQALGSWARIMVGIGFVAHTLSIGAHSVDVQGTPLSGPNIIMLASWVAVLVYFVFEHLLKVKAYGAFFIPVAIAFMGIARVAGSLATTEATNDVFYSWPLLVLHLVAIFLAAALFIIGGVAAGILIYQEWLLKNHKSSTISRRMPSLSALKRVSRRSIIFGFPLLTIGMLLGVVRAAGLGVESWYFETRIVLTSVVWWIYGVYLMQVYRTGATVRASSYVAVLGALVTIVLIVMAGIRPHHFIF